MMLMLIVCCLIGCGTMTYPSLKEQPSGIPDFNIQENYEIVFQRIIAQAKICFEPRGYHIEAKLSRDKQTAEMIISILYRGASKTLLTAHIQALSPLNTQVNTYYAYSPPGKWRDGAYMLQRWAASTEPYCP